MTVDRAPLLAALGVQLSDDLLTVALTHRSYAYENGGLPTNERLEFLGDAVLGLVITAEIFSRYPDRSEGELAKLKSAVVNTQALAEIARGLTTDGLGSHLLLGRGEMGSGGAHKANLLADGLESLLGATYVEHGHEVAQAVVMGLFSAALDTAASLGAGLDWKTSLQELSAARRIGVPAYVVTSTGPEHDKEFTARAVVNGVDYGEGIGRTKKEAEQHAAAAAYQALESAPADPEADAVSNA
ncbi:ribonuclease III [Mycobacterium sp. CBMA293]|uniref:ribonuclease III n=1 Tax=unclassified Mycolicibacterium TaxID=2636767 RepID=UPI001323B282|nr:MULTISPECIES: ribonuclease III [unclassified Mycolicibacterium]MUL45069.1 ribonuclease III [Mycolicibacterium sp. CBMA 360]MUL97366.1 ribonuclease III [Mycolicibacterium sp. CBMA 230]MUM33005.1 ribonuclease III [Mycolicibacterium sp. CBMA 361]MUL57818.1 ribonuclease III [Mycolicibacterium sp. CBMA 335]MUL72733.1 ribonuclease III [Mycolicibacterium sp. CBMA 311]